MKKVLYALSALFLIGIIGVAVFQLKTLAPRIVPQAKLAVYQNSTSTHGERQGSTQATKIDYQHVGGPCPEAKCLIVLMTPWCPKCREIRPVIAVLTEKLSKENIPVSVVIGDDSRENIERFAQQFTSPVLIDPKNQLFSRMSLPGTPYLAVVNQEGVVINDLAGFITDPATLRKALNL